MELLDRLSKLITPPRVHKHRYCGVLAEAYVETQQSRKALALYETLESKLDKAGKLDNSWIPYLEEQKANLKE